MFFVGLGDKGVQALGQKVHLRVGQSAWAALLFHRRFPRQVPRDDGLVAFQSNCDLSDGLIVLVVPSRCQSALLLGHLGPPNLGHCD